MRDMRDLEAFRSFEELRRSHIEGVDYRVEERRGAINLLCAAWHGGRMELGSDILANAIAGERFHYYAFSALIPHSGRGDHPLHITSSRFNEPRLLRIAEASDMVFAIHCCSTAEGSRRIFIGGGARDGIKEGLIESLRAHDFNAGADRLFPGLHPSNPCNRGQRLGVQIEIPQDYMNWLLAHDERFDRLSTIISDYMAALAR